ncbi:MAG TPA: glycosyltransferase [Gemmatimonadaceae bacterium]|nr:glycosyltransferase [Gemmatimonadaceae bacterium]
MLELIAFASVGFLVLVWLAYPLLIAAFSKRPPSALFRSRATEPAVSVIIATRDDEEAVRDRVANCLESTYDLARLEIVIGVDARRGPRAAVDMTSRCCSDAFLGRCIVVGGDDPGGKAATLNAAVRASHGEILVFTDTHQRFDRDAIRQLVRSLQDPRVGASSGSLELPRVSGGRSVIDRYWRMERWLRRCEARVHSCVGVTGAIWAMRRSLWSPLPADVILDDVYTPMRLVLSGYRIAFVESAVAMETRSVGVRHEYRRKVRTLTGISQLLVMLPALLVPKRNPIWAQFIFHKVLRLLTPYWVLAVAIWGAVLIGPWLASHPEVVAAGVIPAMVACCYSGGRRALGRVGGVAFSVFMMQAAVVVATVNGVRRRWDVWTDASGIPDGELGS